MSNVMLTKDTVIEHDEDVTWTKEQKYDVIRLAIDIDGQQRYIKVDKVLEILQMVHMNAGLEEYLD